MTPEPVDYGIFGRAKYDAVNDDVPVAEPRAPAADDFLPPGLLFYKRKRKKWLEDGTPNSEAALTTDPMPSDNSDPTELLLTRNEQRPYNWLVFDLDVGHIDSKTGKEKSNGFTNFLKFCETVLRMPKAFPEPTWMVSTKSGGLHDYYRIPDDVVIALNAPLPLGEDSFLPSVECKTQHIRSFRDVGYKLDKAGLAEPAVLPQPWVDYLVRDEARRDGLLDERKARRDSSGGGGAQELFDKYNEAHADELKAYGAKSCPSGHGDRFCTGYRGPGTWSCFGANYDPALGQPMSAESGHYGDIVDIHCWEGEDHDDYCNDQKAARWARVLSWAREEGHTKKPLKATLLPTPVAESECFPPLARDQTSKKVIWNVEAIRNIIVDPIITKRFAFWRTTDGATCIYRVDENREATALAANKPLLAAVSQELEHRYGMADAPPLHIVEQSMEVWQRYAEQLVQEPALVAFGAGDDLVFKRFTMEPKEGPTPAWDEFLRRLEHPEAFLAWWWSCFEARHRGRQYLWLRGDGQDGKTVVANVLQRVFGQKCGSLAGARPDFMMSAIYGHPVVLYPDCKDYKFGMTAIVRNITSGDPCPIEFKYKGTFTAVLRTRLFVHSNVKPVITGSRADQSRLILIEVAESQEKNDPTWEQRLFEELPAMLWRARDAYQRLCPNHGDIRLPEGLREAAREATEAIDTEWEALFEENFELDLDGRLPTGEMVHVLKANNIDPSRDWMKVQNWKDWLWHTHKIKVHQPPKGGKRYYAGIRLSQQRQFGEFFGSRSGSRGTSGARVQG